MGENGDLLVDSHNILYRWNNCFSKLLNVHRVSDVRQIEIHTAESLIPDPSPFAVKVSIAKLKRYKSPGSERIAAELNKARGEILWSEIHKHINFICNKQELPEHLMSLLLYQFTGRAIKLTTVIIVRYHSYQIHTKCY
jgi:hypothetical protein